MKSPKPPRLDGEREDDYYLRLIQKLANKKLAMFARYQRERELQEAEECTTLRNLQSLKKPKGSLKRGCEVLKEDDDIETIKEKKDGTAQMKVERRPVVINQVTERLKQFVKSEMNGSEMKLLIQKILFASDLKPGQNRLSMPAKQLETNDFLTPDERRKLKDKNINNKHISGIEVGMLGPNLEMYDKMLELKIWDMPCTYNYVLISNWYNFVKEHDKIL